MSIFRHTDTKINDSRVLGGKNDGKKEGKNTNNRKSREGN